MKPTNQLARHRVPIDRIVGLAPVADVAAIAVDAVMVAAGTAVDVVEIAADADDASFRQIITKGSQKLAALFLCCFYSCHFERGTQ